MPALTPRHKNRASTAWTRKLIHLSALSISYWITRNVCQTHLNPESLSLCPTFQLWLLNTAWNKLERKGSKKTTTTKNCRHLFIVCTRKSADYCNGTKHILGFILLIYSCQLSKWWRGIRLGVAGGVVVFIPILFSSFIYFFILETSVANTRRLVVIIARFNKAIIAEKWQTFISSCIPASRCQRGRFKI